VLRDFQGLNRPIVYAIGLLKEEPGPGPGRARRALETLAAETGGVAFFPKNSKEMHQAALKIAEQIRNQYTIGYTSHAIDEPGPYRNLRVTTDRTDIIVRVRLGYLPGLTTPAGKTQRK
jgi:VWFA-related protein